MNALRKLGKSQVITYDGYVDAEIGARMKARLKDHQPPLTQKELAANIEMTPDSFSRALSGKRAFTAVELVKAAEILGTSAHWFVTGEPDPFAVKVAGRHTFDHATRSHQPLDWNTVETVIHNVALAYIQVYPAPAVVPPIRVPRSPEKARAQLRAAGGDNFIRELSSTTEAAFGVDVIRADDVGDGIALDVIGHQAIIVSEIANWFRENWSIAHELGHISRGDLSELGTSACDDPRAEAAANAFAAELLMPQADLRRRDWSGMTLTDLARFVWDYGISTDALGRRLDNLGIQPSDAVQSGIALATQALIRRHGDLGGGNVDLISERMTEASARRFPEHLRAAHIDAVAEGKTGAATLAWMLGAPSEELDEQLAPRLESNVDIDALAQELGLVDPQP